MGTAVSLRGRFETKECGVSYLLLACRQEKAIQPFFFCTSGVRIYSSNMNHVNLILGQNSVFEAIRSRFLDLKDTLASEHLKINLKK
jgi:hypothetical protein